VSNDNNAHSSGLTPWPIAESAPVPSVNGMILAELVLTVPI